MKKLATPELYSTPERHDEEEEVEEPVHHEDGEDVELVCWVVVVQEIPGLSIGQPELVSEIKNLWWDNLVFE